MRLFTFEDGAFASLARLDANVLLAYQTDPRGDSRVIVRDLATERVVFSRVIGGGAAYPLIHVIGARLYVAYREGTNGLLLIHQGESVVSCGPAHGNEPFAFDGEYVYWQCDALYRVVKANLLRPELQPEETGMLGRPTGIARVVNGRPVFRDDDRIYRGLTFPSYPRGHVVCEGAVRGAVIFRESDDYEARVWRGSDCFAPKILDDGQGVIVTTWGSGSVRAAVVQAADFAPANIPTPEPPPPPPAPEPEPPPQVTPMPFEEKHSLTASAFASRFPPPLQDEEAARGWTSQLAQQMAADYPGEGWGHKSAGSGRPPSSDVIARQWGGRLVGYDMLVSLGTPGARFEAHPGEIDLTGQVFIPVTPRDYLTDSPPPTQPPPVVPPDTEYPNLGQYVDELEGLQRQTIMSIAQIQQALQTVVDYIQRGGAVPPMQINVDLAPVVSELQKLNATASQLADDARAGRLQLRVRF